MWRKAAAKSESEDESEPETKTSKTKKKSSSNPASMFQTGGDKDKDKDKKTKKTKSKFWSFLKAIMVHTILLTDIKYIKASIIKKIPCCFLCVPCYFCFSISNMFCNYAHIIVLPLILY